MNINRHNYEEFFLLYVDNELTTAERLEVEGFVDANPDLREELVMFKQTRLKPDAGIRFNAKDLLRKPEQASMINETNYEEFFLLYIDNELDAVLRRQVEIFAASNATMQQELNILLLTKAEPEQSIVFPDKSALYRQPETDRKPVVIAWWRMVAVAAMLLLAAGIFWLNNQGKAPQTDLVSAQDPRQEQPAGKTVAPVKNDNDTGELAINHSQSEKNGDELQPENQASSNQSFEKKSRDSYKVRDNRDMAGSNSQTETIEVIDRAITNADLTIASNTDNRNINTGVETASLNPGVVAIGQPVSNVAEEPVSLNSEDDYWYVANASVSKKTKLRGLVRKLTRVFEKTTNLPAVEEKGILIGGFEIAIK